MAHSHNLQKSLADSGVHINTHTQTEPAAGGRTSDTTQMKTSLTELTTTECEAAAAKISCALKLQWITAQNLRDETCNRPSFPIVLEEVRQADGRTWVTHPCPSACCTLGNPTDSGSKQRTIDEVQRADGRTRVTHPFPSASSTLAYDRSIAQTCTSKGLPQAPLIYLVIA